MRVNGSVPFMRTSLAPVAVRQVEGTLRRRLLINAVVDPDEAAARLPAGLRPHVTDVGTVVGCCLLDVVRLRPVGLPPVAGIGMRAAAHRISAEWDDSSGQTIVGVYVPTRMTDARTAVLAGGRLFPGVHHPARVAVRETQGTLTWSVAARSADDPSSVRVAARPAPRSTGVECSEPVGGTCLTAVVGLSPGRSGGLEAVRMEPDRRTARRVEIDDLDSTFLAGFATAAAAPAYLMEDVAVRWSPV
jgi:Uncharacterized conserved protein (COG2071)